MKKIRIPAFTLIELLVVTVIIGILSTIGVATFNDVREKARVAKILTFAEEFKTKALAENVLLEGIGVTGMYTFDGTTVDADNGNNPNVLDISGSNNHLNYVGVSATEIVQDFSDTPSGTGASLRLPTRQLQTNYYSPPSGPSAPVNKITLSTWIKFSEQVPGNYSIMLRMVGTGAVAQIHSNYGYPANATFTGITMTGDSLEPGVWYHFLASYDDENNVARFWLDGELVAENTGLAPLAGTFTGPIYLGFGGALGSFNGWVDDVIVMPVAFNGVDFD